MNTIQNFLKNQNGATAIEYGLIAALVCVAIIGGLTAFGTSTSNIYDTLSATVTGAMGGG